MKESDLLAGILVGIGLMILWMGSLAWITSKINDIKINNETCAIEKK